MFVFFRLNWLEKRYGTQTKLCNFVLHKISFENVGYKNIKTGIKKQIKKYRVVLSDRVDGLVYSRSCGQMSVRLEFQRLMSNSLSVGKRTDSRSGGRGGSAGTRGRNTQQ